MTDILMVLIALIAGYLIRHTQSLSYDDALNKLKKIERGMTSYNQLHHQWMRLVLKWRDEVLVVTGKIKSGSPDVPVEHLHDLVGLMQQGARLLTERPTIDQEVIKRLS